MWRRGVEVALRECLEVSQKDRVIVLGDRENEEIARAFHEEAKKITESYLVFLEDFGRRPLTNYPWQLREYVDFVKPTVTLYVATVKPNELPHRKGFVEQVVSLGAKHAHMPGITKEILSMGLRECKNVEETTMRVYERVKDAREIEVRTGLGTDLYVKVGRYRWIPDTGKIKYGEWGNLPGGEVFTTPEEIEGTAVADGSLGDYFKKYGKLKHPLVFVIEDSELVDVKSEDEGLASEFWRYVSEVPNGRRVGEFAIGTNINLDRIIGNLLQDEKFPGVHIAFGDPLGERTGAEWTSPIHVDAVITKTDIKVDGEWLMKGGSFV